MSVFKAGKSIEYKYKGKNWKNGEIICANKHEIKIKIAKAFAKFKTITLTKSKAITCLYIKKTLKLSDVIYPSWIKYGTICDVYDKDSFKATECKILSYYSSKDGQSIKIYPLTSSLLTKNNKKYVTIKNKKILTMQQHSFDTDQYIVTKKQFSFYERFRRLYDVPSAIYALIYDYMSFNSSSDCNIYLLSVKSTVMISESENCQMWGGGHCVSFTPKIAFRCKGIEIKANLGGVNAHILMTISNPPQTSSKIKAMKNKNNKDWRRNTENVTRFSFNGVDEILFEPKCFYRLRFHVSDGTPIFFYDYPRCGVDQNCFLKNIKWDTYACNTGWIPIVRLIT